MMRQELNMFAGVAGVVIEQSGVGISRVQLKPSEETFGITIFPKTLLEKSGIPSNESQGVENRVGVLNSRDASTYLFLPVGSTAKHKRERYQYLKQRQGTYHAVTPVHTHDEFKKYRYMMRDGDGHRRITVLGWDEFARQWNASSRYEDTGKEVDGITVFYKTPEHLKAHHSVWSDRRAAGTTIENNITLCDAIRTYLQSPSEVLMLSRQTILNHHCLPPLFLSIYQLHRRRPRSSIWKNTDLSHRHQTLILAMKS